MRRIQKYWLESYDWRSAERELNRFPQFKVDIDGVNLHFIHEKSSGLAAMPLLLIHGWPGSTFEFQHVIPRLAHPQQYGLDPAISFDIVAVSLPGFGFSGKPSRPIGSRRIAALFQKLMTEQLGYGSYFPKAATGVVQYRRGWDSIIPKPAALFISTRSVFYQAGKEQVSWVPPFFHRRPRKRRSGPP